MLSTTPRHAGWLFELADGAPPAVRVALSAVQGGGGRR